MKRICLIIFLPVSIFASDAGHSGSPWQMFLFSVINFILFAGILIYFTGKKIKVFFEERERTIREEFNSYKSSYELAESEIARLREKIAKLQDEKSEIIKTYEERSEALYSELLEKSKKEALLINEETLRRMREEVFSLKESIIKEFVENFIAEVEKRSSTIDEEKKKELKKEFIELLGNIK